MSLPFARDFVILEVDFGTARQSLSSAHNSLHSK
jgi:hypothetical protein